MFLNKKVDLEKSGGLPNHLVEEERRAKGNHSHHEEGEKEEAEEETVQVIFVSFSLATVEVIFVKQLGFEPKTRKNKISNRTEPKLNYKNILIFKNSIFTVSVI